MFTQEDFENVHCPECGGKILYEFGTARCENDDWMCGDTELQVLVDASHADFLETQEDAMPVLFSALEELFGEEGILANKEEQLCECDNSHEQAGTVCRFCYAKNIYQQYTEEFRRGGENCHGT